MPVLTNPLRMLKEYPRQLRIMFYGMLISTMGSSMIWPFLMIYVRERVNLPLAQVASLMTINATAGIIAAFIAGPITDRVGRKWVMVFSLVGNGLVYYFMSSAQGYLSFAILMMLSGSFNPLYRVGADAMVADLIPPENRPDAYALMRLSNNAGISIGPVIGGLISTLSVAGTFFLAGTGMIIYSLLLAFLAIETLPQHAAHETRISKPLGGYLQVLRDSNFLAFIGAFILTQMCATTIWILMPVYANGVYGVPISQYSLIPTTNALMVVFLQIYVTRITKRYRPLPVMLAGAIFYTLGVGTVALGTSFSGFWISIVIMTVGELILMPTSSSYVASLAPPDMRGRYMSVAGLTWSAAAGIAPVLGGYLNDHIAPVATWYGGAVIGLLGMIGFFVLSRREPSPQPAAMPEKIQ
jgi:MFS family permease